MAVTEYYVDPAAGNDTTGDGSISTPWATILYALNTGITRNATDGDRINLKAGTALVLTADQNASTYGTPAAGAQLTIQGYTSVAGDGGIGEIDGDSGLYSAWNDSAKDYINFVDLKIYDCDSPSIYVDDYSRLINVEIDQSDNQICVNLGNYGMILFCKITSSSASSVNTVATGTYTAIYNNYFEGNCVSGEVVNANTHCRFINNVVVNNGDEDGIEVGYGGLIANNTFISNDATSGDWAINADSRCQIFNNYFENWDYLVYVASGDAGQVIHFWNNAYYDLGVSVFENSADAAFREQGTIACSASGVVDKAGGDYTPTSELQALAKVASQTGVTTNYLDIGGIQAEASAGGASIHRMIGNV